MSATISMNAIIKEFTRPGRLGKVALLALTCICSCPVVVYRLGSCLFHLTKFLDHQYSYVRKVLRVTCGDGYDHLRYGREVVQDSWALWDALASALAAKRVLRCYMPIWRKHKRFIRHSWCLEVPPTQQDEEPDPHWCGMGWKLNA